MSEGVMCGVNMKTIIKATCLTAVLSISAAFGQGFGGQQSQGKIDYSEKFADLNYASDSKTYHTLDIYLPKETRDSYPVVVHTYGSAWSMNNSKGSADLNTICAGFLKAGYAVVTPNHRSASDAIAALRTSKSQTLSYSVYSLDGTLVSRSNQLNKQALKPGVYYVIEKKETNNIRSYPIIIKTN